MHGQVNIVFHEPMIQLTQELAKARGGVVRLASLNVDTSRAYLAQVTPDGLNTFFFWNSGAEAVEASIKLARYFEPLVSSSL